MRVFGQQPKPTQQIPSAKSKAATGDVGRGPSSTTGVARFTHDFSRIPVHAKTPASKWQKPLALRVEDRSTPYVRVQPKLLLDHPQGPDEEEAERVAEKMSRKPEGSMPAPKSGPPGAVRGMLVPEALIQGVGTGLPLDSATRGSMESGIGHDFGDVRVHADETAARSARAIGARAYTMGRDVVFGRGEYQPWSQAGRHLIAHELTHVKQQSVSAPLLQRAPIPGPNFTPSDFGKLKGAGKDLTIAPDSNWFPSKLQDNLLNTLRFVLGPKISPSGTEGINVLDFFHGHLVVNRKDLLVDWQGKERVPENATKHALEFEKQEKSAAAKTLGGKVTDTKWGPSLSFRGKYPVTSKNLPAFTTAIEKLLPAFGNMLEEGAKVPGAACMYHTFELIAPSDVAAAGKKLAHDNPRRHYVTPLDTNTPRQYTPPSPDSYEKEYHIIAPFSFLVDTNGAVHVRPFAASAGSTFTSLELSTITGTPFAGEPFPVP